METKQRKRNSLEDYEGANLNTEENSEKDGEDQIMVEEQKVMNGEVEGDEEEDAFDFQEWKIAKEIAF